MSQRRWRGDRGRDYQGDGEGARRVREWRAANPGYSRRPARPQDDLGAVLAEFSVRDSCGALQDSWAPQVVALVGLIARLGGLTLQNAIARELREIMVTGHALLDALPSPSTTNRPATPPAT